MVRSSIYLLAALLLGGWVDADSSSKICEVDSVYVGANKRVAITADKFLKSAVNFEQQVSVELAGSLEKTFLTLVEEQTKASRASIAIWSPSHGYWSANHGDGKNDVYWWASVGKLVTASIILQLVRDDDLSLDAPIANWFPNYPNAKLITIDHLLTHTGGVFSFNSDPQLNEQGGHKSVDLLVSASAAHGADFCPGTNWNYSNTGYVMLSHIAEQVSNESFAELVKLRISEPLSLPTLKVVEPNDGPEVIVAPGGEAPPTVSEIASIYGAGAIVANAEDMLGLLTAYVRGDTTSEKFRNLAFADLYPMFGSPMNYGRGVMVTDVPDTKQPTIWLGHSGGSPNAKGIIIYDVERGIFLALVLNIQASAEALANTILKEFDGIN